MYLQSFSKSPIKMLFLGILFQMKIFVLPFVISVPVLSFQIFTAKLILWPKMGLTYAISIVNWIFGNCFAFLHSL